MTERRFVEYTPTGKLVKHGGSGSAYSHWGCRCDACVEANRARVARRLAERRGEEIPEDVEHGKSATYANCSCRCEECNAAWRVSVNSYYARVLSAEARAKKEQEAYERGLKDGKSA